MHVAEDRNRKSHNMYFLAHYLFIEEGRDLCLVDYRYYAIEAILLML